MNKAVFVLSTWFLLFSFSSCSSQDEIPVLFHLPKSLKEVSGITSDKNSLWAIADSGNKNVIFQLNWDGKLIKEVTISNAENIDWEDLSRDVEGNLYVGDFGNNDNTRKDLCIYKISKDSLDTDFCKASAKISFSYPEQKEFPPKKTELIYDAEAFIVFQNYFYIFTKNRSKNSDGTTLLYRIPMIEGHHQAILVGSFVTDQRYSYGAVTSAAISPNQQKVVLLSNQKVWLFENFESDHFFEGKKTEIDLNHYSQKEAITFKDNHILWIADEKVKKNGGNVYQVPLKP
ncbi:NHL repeat-containing protein [Flavobacterium luminosum]|uniref:T9SS C-terminal target domain-containing protein n=1 Tax=Flavobacterium luminosum TaxID=2949086 RepID=A0ABT0TN83_9FLAO|nr:hypothetical protein [Flavobacterium sp. HXWNR70]MCL9808956.1 hypothetical protein [Flavobacterium sp. HXWNR70]